MNSFRYIPSTFATDTQFLFVFNDYNTCKTASHHSLSLTSPSPRLIESSTSSCPGQDTLPTPFMDSYSQHLVEDLLPPEIDFLDPNYQHLPEIYPNWNEVFGTTSVIVDSSFLEFNVETAVDSLATEQPLKASEPQSALLELNSLQQFSSWVVDIGKEQHWGDVQALPPLQVFPVRSLPMTPSSPQLYEEYQQPLLTRGAVQCLSPPQFPYTSTPPTVLTSFQSADYQQPLLTNATPFTGLAAALSSTMPIKRDTSQRSPIIYKLVKVTSSSRHPLRSLPKMQSRLLQGYALIEHETGKNVNRLFWACNDDLFLTYECLLDRMVTSQLGCYWCCSPDCSYHTYSQGNMRKHKTVHSKASAPLYFCKNVILVCPCNEDFSSPDQRTVKQHAKNENNKCNGIKKLGKKNGKW